MDTYPNPVTPATALHLPLVASSLRIAFQYKRHVMVCADSQEVEVFHGDTCIAAIQSDGELYLAAGTKRSNARRRHLNTVFYWIGVEERIELDEHDRWIVTGSTPPKLFYDQYTLFHPNIYR